jgi:uridine kinase
MATLGRFVEAMNLPHPTRVAIDGITAAGKSTLAGELAVQIQQSGRPVIHLTMDGFHHRRQHRHRKGRMSAFGYYDDAYDFAAFVESVLVPLGPAGDRRFRERLVDLATDEPVADERRRAPADAVVIVDGSFLQRPEIRRFWDITVFVDTSFPIALERGVARDAASMGGIERAREAYTTRYHAAARMYVDRVRPVERAAVVVENDDPAQPVVRFVTAATTAGIRADAARIGERLAKHASKRLRQLVH